jgi:hypothetical protein
MKALASLFQPMPGRVCVSCIGGVVVAAAAAHAIE